MSQRKRTPTTPPVLGATALLVKLESAFDHLPVALARGAKYVLENPEKVVHQPLAELSSYAGTGEATMLRLCRELGFAGYTDFKIALSAELAVKNSRQPSAGVEADAVGRLANQLCASIHDTRALLQPNILERVAQRLKKATRVDVFGVGVSGLIAEMLGYRLLRAGCNAIAMKDPVLAHEVSTGLTSKSAVIAVSQSGSTTETINFVKTARAAGAFTMAITCHPRSALARSAQETLAMAGLKEPTFGGTITDVPRCVIVAEALALAIENA